MTISETKKWLRRAWLTDQYINLLMRKHYEEFERANSITAQLSGMPSSPSKDPHKLDRIAELGESIKAEIEALTNIKREIRTEVNELEDDMQKIVLIEYYIPDSGGMHKTLDDISNDYNYSRRQISRFHKAGIEALSKRL